MILSIFSACVFKKDVSPPRRPHRRFRIAAREPRERHHRVVAQPRILIAGGRVIFLAGARRIDPVRAGPQLERFRRCQLRLERLNLLGETLRLYLRKKSS
jgi:hypothetical protein